jgi:hypothetical protein
MDHKLKSLHQLQGLFCVDDHILWTWKEMVVAYFEALSRHPEGTVENHSKPQDSRVLSEVQTEHLLNTSRKIPG